MVDLFKTICHLIGLFCSGIVFVVAAGNEGNNWCILSPASVETAIVVGATRSNDARASFSNYGSCLDVSWESVLPLFLSTCVLTSHFAELVEIRSLHQVKISIQLLRSPIQPPIPSMELQWQPHLSVG